MNALVQFAQKALIEWEGKVLMIRKSQDDPHHPGRWELPGGRMKLGESPDEALVREVLEEVGLKVQPGRPLALWSWRLGSGEDAPTVVAVARLCTASGGDVDMSRNDESDCIEKFGWFERDEVLDLDLIPNSRVAMADALANLQGQEMREKIAANLVLEADAIRKNGEGLGEPKFHWLVAERNEVIAEQVRGGAL